MSREVLEMVEKLDRIELKTQLALQCAPLLTGIKPSNLLTLKVHSEQEVEALFRDTDITVHTLCKTDQQTVLLLFRKKELLTYLEIPEVRNAMRRFGYETLDLIDIFENLCAHYQKYMKERQSFPHELGLLLGYPVCDVIGFIENGGQNYQYSGYWKVYGDVAAAKETFRCYNEAKEQMIRMMAAGLEITSLLHQGQMQLAG